MELLIGSRLSLRTRMSTMSSSKVLADNPRDVTGDTTGAIRGLANDSQRNYLGPKLTIRHAQADCVHLQYAKVGLPSHLHG
jgi:hypothetical protein